MADSGRSPRSETRRRELRLWRAGRTLFGARTAAVARRWLDILALSLVAVAVAVRFLPALVTSFRLSDTLVDYIVAYSPYGWILSPLLILWCVGRLRAATSLRVYLGLTHPFSYPPVW